VKYNKKKSNSSLSNTNFKRLAFIGVASGWGAQIQGTEDGPLFVGNNFDKIENMCKKRYKPYWDKTIFPEIRFKKNKKHITFVEKEHIIASVCKKLKSHIIYAIGQNRFPIIIGGDHSLAIGTWSGIAHAYNCHQLLGLIWVDAHMDSHTPYTSQSHAIHGMPLTVLMGYGSSIMTKTIEDKKIINPKHLVLIGVRSFEEEEKLLLEKLGVKVYFIGEVLKNGFKKTLEESINYLHKYTNIIGLSLDLDVFDPIHAPGTGSKEPNGLSPDEFLNAIVEIPLIKELVAIEIMEFNPHLDKDSITFDLIANIIKYISSR